MTHAERRKLRDVKSQAWMAQKLSGRTFADIARENGVTAERVRQIVSLHPSYFAVARPKNPHKDGIVKVLREGASNSTIASHFGVSVNVVAGLRKRVVGSKITAAEARALGCRASGVKKRTETETRIIAAIKGGVTRCPLIAGCAGHNVQTVRHALRRLVERGAVLRHSSGRWPHYELPRA